jgi:hypothetical protein
MSELPNKPRSAPPFPAVMNVNGRGYLLRSHLEAYKRDIIRHALGGQTETETPPPPGPDELVPLKVAAVELGVGRRTIGRRMKPTTIPDPVAA